MADLYCDPCELSDKALTMGFRYLSYAVREDDSSGPSWATASFAEAEQQEQILHGVPHMSPGREKFC